MTKSSKALTPVILCVSLLCNDALAYDLSRLPDRYQPNPAYADVFADSPAPRQATIRSLRLFGGDTYAGYGGVCPNNDTSCAMIFVTNNGKTRLFEKSAKKCIPQKGPGILSDAVTSFAASLFSNVAIPQASNRYGDQPSGVAINIRICESNSFHLVYSSEGSISTPLVCVIDAPPIVDLGELTENTTRAVRSAVTCSGGGETDIRVSVVGPSTSSPVPGLELWASAPERALHITGDGAPSYVDLTVGATVNSPKPGFYSAAFVYTVEYL